MRFFQLLFLRTGGAAAAAGSSKAQDDEHGGPVTPFRDFEDLLSRFAFMEREGAADALPVFLAVDGSLDEASPATNRLMTLLPTVWPSSGVTLLTTIYLAADAGLVCGTNPLDGLPDIHAPKVSRETAWLRSALPRWYLMPGVAAGGGSSSGATPGPEALASLVLEPRPPVNIVVQVSMSTHMTWHAS